MTRSEYFAELARVRKAMARRHAIDLARLPRPEKPVPTTTARERAIQRATEAAR